MFSSVLTLWKHGLTRVELVMDSRDHHSHRSTLLKGGFNRFGRTAMPIPASELSVRLLFLLGLFAGLGCSARRIPVPAIDPELASQSALVLYDRNHDGFLDATELRSCPALASCLKILDQDKDGRLSGTEIASRIASYQSSRIGLSTVGIQVTLNGQPLSGATVTFDPERFLGDALKPAVGITDDRGVVCVATLGEELPGVACGLYRIEISKKDAAGREIIAACYNQATVLGLEVAPGTNLGGRTFALRNAWGSPGFSGR